jgi:hypothetical protein
VTNYDVVRVLDGLGGQGERRRSLRRVAAWPLHWSRTGQSALVGELLDVSEDGLAFRALHPGRAPAPGDLIQLALVVRDVVLDLRGRVVSADARDRIGAAFLAVPPEDRVILRQFVQSAR